MVFPVRAAASPLEMRKFKKYIIMVGFRFYQSGKGDHEIWINSKGVKLTVNPHKSDRRYVDRATAISLKKILGYSESQLYTEVNKL